MQSLLGFFRKYERQFLALLLAVVWAVLYFGAHAVPHLQPARVLEWDPVWHVPLIGAFIVPYLSLGIMPLLLYLLSEDHVFFRHWVMTVSGAAAVSAAVYIVLPLDMPRPALDGDDVFSPLLALTYAVDVRGNFFPSQHVIFAFLTALGIGYERPRWRSWMLAWAALIAVSTLFVHQHYLVDVISGMALAFAAWGVLLRLRRRQ